MTTVEYGLIAAGVVVVAIPGIIAIQNASTSTYQSTINQDPGVGGIAGDGVNDLPAAPFANTVSLGVPTAPNNVTATTSGNQVQVIWSAPTSDGGSVITAYSVSGTGGATCTPSPATSTSCVTPALPDGAYSFTVTATNAYGPGPASAPASASVPVAVTVPGAPTGLTATGGNLSVDLAWSAPVLTGGSPITDYVVQYRTTVGPGAWVTFNDGLGTGLTATVTGLVASTSYDFRVAATNSVGTGSYSAIGTAPTNGVPGAPTSVSGTPGDTEVTVSWSAPTSNGGSPITAYTATSSPGSFTCSPTPLGNSCVVAGLANGTAYTFTVTATNVVGIGPASAASASITPRTVPGAPTSVTGVAGNAQVTVSWTAPASNGGAAIIDYTVTSSGGQTCTANHPTTSCTVTGLVNGDAYTFSVTARNAAGSGAASTASAAVRPLAACSVRDLGTISVSGSSPFTVNLMAGVTGGVVTGRTPDSAPTVKTDGTVALTTPNSANVTWSVSGAGAKEWNGSFDYTASTCSGTGTGTVKLSKS